MGHIDVMDDRRKFGIVSDDVFYERLFVADMRTAGDDHQHVFTEFRGSDQKMTQTAFLDPFVIDRKIMSVDQGLYGTDDLEDLLITDHAVVDRYQKMGIPGIVAGDDLPLFVLSETYLDLVAVIERPIGSDHSFRGADLFEQFVILFLFQLDLFAV